MQKTEIMKIMAIIASEYGDRFTTSKDKADLWMTILGHANFDEAAKAVAEILGSPARFPPTVGEINHKILQARTGVHSLDWASEWECVLKAAANSSYNAEREAARLPEHTLRACGGIPGLKEIAMIGSGELMAIRAQFRQRFEMLSTKKVEREFQGYIESRASEILQKIDNAKLPLVRLLNEGH